MEGIFFGQLTEHGTVELQRFYRAEASRLKGKRVVVEVEKNIRSQQQNRYLWGVVYRMISDETGYETEEVHQMFADKYLGYEKKGRKFRKSTTGLSKAGFSDYVEKIRRYVAQKLNLVIPDPNY